MKLAALVVSSFLGLNAYVFYFMGAQEHPPARRAFSDFPLAVSGWECPGRQTMEDGIEQRLGVTDYWICDYHNQEDDKLVNVYVGYHVRQVREGAKSSAESSIHPPKHCLPGSGWNIIQSDLVPLDVGQGPRTVNRLVIAKGEFRQLVYYWYQERGRVIASDYEKILYLFWDRATRARSDGSLVRFMTPIDRSGEGPAQARIEALVSHLVPLLPAFVPD